MAAIAPERMWRFCFVASLMALLPCLSLSFAALGENHRRGRIVVASLFLGDHRRSTTTTSSSVLRRMAQDDEDDDFMPGATSINVLGTTMLPCCTDVGGTGIGTGFYRNGYCSTGEQDLGRHTVCVQVTNDFLAFSTQVGNDLSTPVPEYSFPGLKDGDIWCLCAQRWAQAFSANKAPPLFLQATHEKTLDYVSFESLRKYALDADQADEALESLNEMRDKLNKLL